MRQDSTSLHISAVIGAAFLWSTSFAVTKVVLRDVGALTLGALRFLAAGILLITIVCSSEFVCAHLCDHMPLWRAQVWLASRYIFP